VSSWWSWVFAIGFLLGLTLTVLMLVFGLGGAG
jgi:hypothetical protein